MSDKAELPYVVICTDGSCEPNPGEAAWGAVLIWPETDQSREAGGYIGQATNNIAELTAPIEALKLLEEPHRVDLNSDSEWLVNCAIGTWRRCEPKHRELWRQLDEMVEQHVIEWHWVKGHAGDPCNERAHALAEHYRGGGQKPKKPFGKSARDDKLEG
jgi:ribonuclease HI